MTDTAESVTTDRRKTVVGVLVALVIVVVVFGVLLPNLVDWNAVFDALADVSGTDLALLLVLGLAIYVPAGWVYATVAPGLRVGQGTQTWVATTAVSTTLPGMDLVLRIAMYTSWGLRLETAMVGTFLSGLVEMSTKLLLAVLAVAVGAAAVNDLGLLAIAGIAAAVLGVIGVGVLVVLRSEDAARRFGDRAQRFLHWGFAKVNRTAPSDVEERVLSARHDARSVLANRWPQAFAGAFLTQALVFAVLVVSLRAVGADAGILPLADILLVHAAVVIITSIPITPGSIGIATFAYTGLFVAVAGDEFGSLFAAGVLLFRAFTWLLPIPIGWVAALVWKARSGQKLFAAPDAPVG